MENTYSIDISHWQPGLDLDILYKNGIRMIILKSTSGDYSVDPAFEFNARKIRKDGRFKLGIYHWCDPISKSDRQADFCLKVIKQYKPDVVCPDIEQWWSDWKKWGQYRFTNPSKIPKAKPEKISEDGYIFCKKAENEYPIEKIQVYTNANTVHYIAPQMQKWIGKYPLWVAQYIRGLPAVTTWERFYQDVEPILNRTQKPIIKGAKKLARWQFTGDLMALPGSYQDFYNKRPSELDINLELIDDIFDDNIEIPNEPDEKDLLYQMIITTSAIYKRESPIYTATAVGYVAKNNIVDVYAESGDWVQINKEPEQWIRVRSGKNIYAKKL